MDVEETGARSWTAPETRWAIDVIHGSRIPLAWNEDEASDPEFHDAAPSVTGHRPHPGGTREAIG
ncbi:hypothetical protein CFN78_17950 [Amycolatopsis antarctica]|uniref:Uncharacterized protein n=1 Tax=Amycolatopsis antarctica TaxID=1854586 RepID=A0A263D320_9PSEU|nr:hypothetical protein CFN78_17950 [Amycolatopsis antarctica]